MEGTLQEHERVQMVVVALTILLLLVAFLMWPKTIPMLDEWFYDLTQSFHFEFTMGLAAGFVAGSAIMYFWR